MRLLVAASLFLIFANCTQQDKAGFVSPPGYDINKPEKIKVKEILDEISGIVYDKDRNALIAEDDEQGRLFIVDLANPFAYKLSKFGPPGDYEDLAFTGKEWFVLKSNGELYFAKNAFTDSATHEKFPFSEKGNEFEGLYYDQASNCLWLLCKSCNRDKGKNVVSLYSFDVTTRQFKDGPLWQLDVNKIKDQLSSKDPVFKPSAIAMHPLQKKLYILSGVNKLLVIADSDGNIQSAYKLNPAEFKQPEGITFSDNGDMYISNEATEDTYANILKFTYNQASK